MSDPSQEKVVPTSEADQPAKQEPAEPHTPGMRNRTASLTEAEFQIIEEYIRQGGEYNMAAIATRLKEEGFSREETQLEVLLEKYREDEPPLQQPSDNAQVEPIKQSRPTANQAKKFIVDCATTLNAKPQWSKKKKPQAEEELVKKRRNEQTKPQPKSKRKVRPQQPLETSNSTNSEQRFLSLESTYRDCQNLLTKRNSKKSQISSVPIPKCYSWVEHEFFYSNYDLPYYDYNEFQEIMQHIGVDPLQKYSDYQAIRSAIGKPRLFSHDFIQQERNNLENYRQTARSYAKNDNINELIESVPNRSAIDRFKQMTALKVGQVVVALHPVCAHLHIGSILALYKQNQIMVKFQNPELGVQKVLDVNISSEYNLKRTDMSGRDAFQFANQDIIENFDYQAAALALQTLHYKNELILQLKNNNSQLEEMKALGQPITQQFKQQYGWVNCLINILNFCLKHIMTRFRLRGASSYNMEEVGRNLPKLLTNPLNFMEKELQDNIESHDTEALRKLRQIVAQQQEVPYKWKQNRIEEATSELCRRYNPQKRELDYEPLVRSFVSLLMTLKLEGRINNVKDNKHMECMAEHLYQGHQEQFAEIGDLLLSISNK